MELNWYPNAGVCKCSHFLIVSRCWWKTGHNLMCPQGSEQGGLKDPSTDWYSLKCPRTAISRMVAVDHTWLLSHLCSQLTKVWQVMAANGIRNSGNAFAKALGWKWPLLVSVTPVSWHTPSLPGLFILLAMIRHLFRWVQEPACHLQGTFHISFLIHCV